jgi:hypothetical protein
MEMLCPECMGTLVTLDGQAAVCTTHNGKFQILFSHWKPPPPPPPDSAPAVEYRLAPGAVCIQHPHVTAAFACRDCGAAVCNVCAFTESDGSAFCPSCTGRRVSLGRFAGAAATMAPSLLVATATRLPDGVRCVQHPNVTATAQCRSCGAFMCVTCDFELPGGLHVCPACAAAPKTTLSPKRKGLLIGSFALAVWSTLGMAVLLSGALADMIKTKEGEAALGVALSLLLLIPSIIGLALGFSAMDRRLVNGPAIWIAVVWNGMILAAFLLLSVIGTFS